MIEHFVLQQDIIKMICGEIKIIEERSDNYSGYYSIDEDYISLDNASSIKAEDMLVAAHEAFHALRFRTKAVKTTIVYSISKMRDEEFIVQNLAEKWCLENLNPELYDHNEIFKSSSEIKDLLK
jgi:DNA recombination-dependent growth factor C